MIMALRPVLCVLCPHCKCVCGLHCEKSTASKGGPGGLPPV